MGEGSSPSCILSQQRRGAADGADMKTSARLVVVGTIAWVLVACSSANGPNEPHGPTIPGGQGEVRAADGPHCAGTAERCTGHDRCRPLGCFEDEFCYDVYDACHDHEAGDCMSYP